MESTPEDDKTEQQPEQRHNLKFDRDNMTANELQVMWRSIEIVLLSFHLKTLFLYSLCFGVVVLSCFAACVLVVSYWRGLVKFVFLYTNFIHPKKSNCTRLYI